MRKQKSKKVFIYFFFTLVTVNNKKISNDFYKIKEFQISGLNNIETKKILDSLIISKCQYFFI